MKFGENLSRSFFEILKSQKSELDKFIPNFPVKHVITSANLIQALSSDRNGFKALPA